MASNDSNVVCRFRATLDGELLEVDYRSGDTLLDSMINDGLDPAFGCMDAQCGTCMVKLLAGDVTMRKTDALSKRDVEQGYVLLCQSEPLGEDVWVDCDV